MKRMRMASVVVMSMAMAVLLGGCGASHQARSVDLKQSTLVNPALYKEGTDDQALYKYAKPNLDLKQYSKVLIDPVLIRKDGELDKDELENYQKLANNAFVYLNQELGKDYSIVKAPEPGTLRIQVAITDADSAKPVRNTLSTLMPIGIGISWVKYAATGKQSGVGEITAEMRISDAATGELLAAALDRRVGGKELSELWSSWHNADSALLYWAQKTRWAFCDMRGGGAKCVKPGAEPESK
ncbi:MAG TPA: DUF3313 domain-containing protein [Geobacteraceae bacterium]